MKSNSKLANFNSPAIVYLLSIEHLRGSKCNSDEMKDSPFRQNPVHLNSPWAILAVLRDA
ncbi:hypothetical protein Spb1_14100 [Planctopirus ephydatiae]|jgi:hypothetical protein|uniref:Uncharacterized protein n=1 Tax=Planctopirus ephydatiae TaxID=2528019 RepID=A0A518GLH0_9PLAN|nr:hypothetical protein Spb1_14100 [Planctopirus ephydatiae]